MARKKQRSLSRKSAIRPQYDVCWVSAEGTVTERDYLSMDVFKNRSVAVRFPPDIKPGKQEPSQVLERMKRHLKNERLRSGDQAWVVVDVDDWQPSDLESLYAWAESNAKYHVAVSNPKFELFLVMHYEDANGCTTASNVDRALQRYLPSYRKQISPRQFNESQVRDAVRRSKNRRRAGDAKMPPPGTTDMHLLVESLLKKNLRCD